MATKIDVGLWQSRVSAAMDFQSENSKYWGDIIDLYKGNFFGENTSKYSDISEVNFLYEYTVVKRGGIYARNPHIFVRALSTSKVPFAETMEQVINYYWRELKLKQKVKQTITHSILIPPAFIGVGYTGTIVKKEQDPFALEETKPIVKTEAERGILDETVKDDDVFAEFISPYEMLWPKGYHNLRDCPYMIRVQTVRLIDVMHNPIFKNARFKLKQTESNNGLPKKPTFFSMKANVPLSNDSSYDAELIDIKLFHIWDKRTNMRFVIAEGFNDDTLFERDWNYLIEGFPFYDLSFNEIPATGEDCNSYPLSDVTPMLPQLRDLSIINAAMLKQGKRAGTVILVKEGGITDEEITRLQSSGDTEVVKLSSLSEQDIKPFQTPSLPSDWYRLRSQVLEDLMRISGFQQLLGQAQGVETATESDNLRQGQLLRQSESVDIIEDFTVDIARGLSGLIWQFIQDKERIAQIIGEDVSEEMWPTLPDDPTEARRIIQKELQFRIDAGSTRPPKDEAVERKQWENLAGVLKANFPGRIKDDVFLTQLLKKYDFKDIDQMIIKFDDQEVAAAQEENKLLMQNNIQVISPNENHKLHLQVHGQASQVPGMQLTQAFDEHVMKHAQFLEMQSPTVSPQRGDSKIAPQTGSPDQRRQGVPTGATLAGAANNITQGTGVQTA